jgi:hypothetical protein
MTHHETRYWHISAENSGERREPIVARTTELVAVH